ncbi:MAG TPA: adenylate/guanylate cyclase domain-containing protein [Roseiarcus sp.]|nr:adenylate/guanylate cyclase domain-containing protein [Roseiarcus sp.]
MSESRKLAAILVADVVGYSRLAGAEEERTLARLRGLRSDLIDPAVAAHHGRVVKRTGDGAIVEFRSAVDAVRCAIEVQNGMVERNAGLAPDRRIDFRIGVHIGDVVQEADGDLMGDGVNIAARLQGVAEPGAICLSEDAFRQVRSRLDLQVSDLGATQLKNIAQPIRIYSLQVGVSDEPMAAIKTGPATKEETSPPPALPEKPSIAVLPFENMSGDAEQDYFCDGMVEDIITGLSRIKWLFVIARNSSFTYKGRAVDVRQVGRDLGVRYVLEGSVRKAGARVRITGQLVNASTGAHVWADRFDGELADIFDLQDQVTTRVVGAIAPKLEQAEIERAKRKPTENLDAYDYFLRGMAAFYQYTRTSNEEALRLFSRAIELDPDFASAYGMAARCYMQRKGFGWVDDREREVAEADRLARRAADLGRDDAVALCTAGFALAVVVGALDEGAVLIDRGLALNPNLAWAWHFSALIKAWLGEPEIAIEHAARAIRHSPQDPQLFAMQTAAAFGHFVAARYDQAFSVAETAVREQPNFLTGQCVAAASGALADRLPQANKAMARVLRLDPALRISNLSDFLPFGRQEDFDRWAEGLRKAGLPE